MISANGQLVLPGNRTAAATPYRYTTLIEHARLLAGQARDIEATMLAALQNRDAEALNLVRARQEVRVARASARLHELRVNQAQDRVTLTQLQQQRATFEEQHYQDLLDAGQNAYELEALGWLIAASQWQTRAAAASLVAAVADLVAAGAYAWKGPDSVAQAASSLASSGLGDVGRFLFFRCECIHHVAMEFNEGWLRTDMAGLGVPQVAAGYDRQIAGQQVTIETDGMRIAEQEREIGDLQADNAEQLLEFQQAKFTNVELYDWMAGVLNAPTGGSCSKALPSPSWPRSSSPSNGRRASRPPSRPTTGSRPQKGWPR